VGVEPTSAGLQPAASPSGSSVKKCPRQESNLAYDRRRVACLRHTPRTFQYPDLDSNQGPDLRRVRCIRYTIGTTRAGGGGRTHMVRLTRAAPFSVEPHRQYHGARSVSEGCSVHKHVSRSARIRTLCGWFGISLLSQEHAPVNRPVCLAGIEPGTPRFTASYASRYTTDTVNQRRGWESNPQGLAARSLSRRGPSPYRVARPKQIGPMRPIGPIGRVVPGGIEPPISSVSGRRLGHSTTGLSPTSTPARNRTRTSSFEARRDVRFTTRAIQRKVRESNPHSPQGNRVSTAARPTVSGYLPKVETVGIEPTSVCLQDRLACPWHMRPRQ
jgi:hypothetical protein